MNNHVELLPSFLVDLGHVRSVDGQTEQLQRVQRREVRAVVVLHEKSDLIEMLA